MASPLNMYEDFINTNLHRLDNDYIRDYRMNNEDYKTVNMDAYVMGLRIYVSAYGKKKKYQEFVDICNSVLMELATASPSVDTVNKYIEFCETFQPKAPDFASLLDLCDCGIDTWVRGITYYIENKNNCDKQGKALIDKMAAPPCGSQIQFEGFKLDIKIVAKYKTQCALDKSLELYSRLISKVAITDRFAEDLMIHLGKIDYPLSNLVCTILEDIVAKCSNNPLAKFAQICLNFESQLLNNEQTLPARAVEQTSEEFARFLKESQPIMFELYFYFLDRIRSVMQNEHPWFKIFKSFETVRSFRNWWKGLLSIKRSVPIDVLRNSVLCIEAAEEKKSAMPLVEQLLQRMIDEGFNDKSFKEVFEHVVLLYHKENDYELLSFSFRCWKLVYCCAKNGTMLKESLEKNIKDHGKHLLLFVTHREEGIDAARAIFSTMKPTRIVIETMLDIEITAPEINLETIRSYYHHILFGLDEPFLKHKGNEVFDVLMSWADFEELYGSVNYVKVIADRTLSRDQRHRFHEKWSHTRLFFTNSP